MKGLLLALAIFNTANASEITCWSGQHKIYHGHGYNIQVEPVSILFRECKTNQLVYVMGNCILRSEKKRHKLK